MNIMAILREIEDETKSIDEKSVVDALRKMVNVSPELNAGQRLTLRIRVTSLGKLQVAMMRVFAKTTDPVDLEPQFRYESMLNTTATWANGCKG